MKRLVILVIGICSCVFVYSQATDLVVDCQNPGWLSYLIDYGDQQTVKNLKVTGCVNNDDLSFIGTLASKHQLNEVLDIGEVTIVGDNNNPDNCFDGTKLLPSYPYDDISPTLIKLVCPKSATVAKNIGAGFKFIDSLICDINIPTITQDLLSYNPSINHIFLGENITSVYSFGRGHSVKSIHFPSSLKVIEDFALSSILNDLSLSNISLFPNLEYLGYMAFVNTINTDVSNKETLPDTIKLPNIKEYNVPAFDYKKGMHIFLGNNVDRVNYVPKVGYSNPWYPSLQNVTFHIASLTPPKTENVPVWNYGLTVYVPEEAVEAYKQKYCGWENANILPEPNPLKGISINMHEVLLEIEDSIQLTAITIPQDLDNVSIIWNCDDISVADVSDSGLVKAILKELQM